MGGRFFFARLTAQGFSNIIQFSKEPLNWLYKGQKSRTSMAALKKVLGVILAGGEGRRLYPLTQQRAKPAVPFGGKYRLIDFALSNFINSRI
jgi:hypothetical protein